MPFKNLVRGSPVGDPRIILTTDCSNDNDIQRIAAAIEYIREGCRRGSTDLRVIRDVEPYSILDGAFHLADQGRTWQWAKPIHVGVVDPGVGTDRRAIAFTTRAGAFVGPDNGLSTLFRGLGWDFEAEFAVELHPAIRDLVPKSFEAPTFDGERLFGPAAALLSAGERIEELGKEVPADDLINLDIHEGTILHKDKHFKNLKVHGLHSVYGRIRRRLVFTVNGNGPFEAKKGRTLADGEDADFVIYPGSSALLEIAKFKGFAGDLLCANVGDRVIPDLLQSA